MKQDPGRSAPSTPAGVGFAGAGWPPAPFRPPRPGARGGRLRKWSAGCSAAPNASGPKPGPRNPKRWARRNPGADRRRPRREAAAVRHPVRGGSGGKEDEDEDLVMDAATEANSAAGTPAALATLTGSARSRGGQRSRGNRGRSDPPARRRLRGSGDIRRFGGRPGDGRHIAPEPTFPPAPPSRRGDGGGPPHGMTGAPGPRRTARPLPHPGPGTGRRRRARGRRSGKAAAPARCSTGEQARADTTGGLPPGPRRGRAAGRTGPRPAAARCATATAPRGTPRPTAGPVRGLRNGTRRQRGRQEPEHPGPGRCPARQECRQRGGGPLRHRVGQGPQSASSPRWGRCAAGRSGRPRW